MYNSIGSHIKGTDGLSIDIDFDPLINYNISVLQPTLLLTMPRGRPGRQTSCLHCGRRGHVSNVCPRDDYSGGIPALELACTSCVRRVITAVNDNTYQIYCAIDPCSLHSTLTAQPTSYANPSPLKIKCITL